VLIPSAATGASLEHGDVLGTAILTVFLGRMLAVMSCEHDISLLRGSGTGL
jgi:hypothetical protein